MVCAIVFGFGVGFGVFASLVTFVRYVIRSSSRCILFLSSSDFRLSRNCTSSSWSFILHSSGSQRQDRSYDPSSLVNSPLQFGVGVGTMTGVIGASGNSCGVEVGVGLGVARNFNQILVTHLKLSSRPILERKWLDVKIL
jgi:hypothetical protein